MVSNVSRRLAVIVVLAGSSALVRSDDAKGFLRVENALVGTWKLVSTRVAGEEHKYPKGSTTLKHVTPTQFMWVTYDKDGKVLRAVGGRYTLKDKVYEEVPLYGISTDFDLIKGKSLTFQWKVDGNKWRHIGKISNGQTIEEIWERVENK